MEPDIAWLTGRRLTAIEKLDWSWFFRLDDAGVIATETAWRMITPQGVVVTSEDHEQKFGLPAPLNAANVVRKEIGGLIVSGYHLDPKTGDLNLEFGSVTLQFLCTSSGYESWRITHGTLELICTGGGKLYPYERKVK